MYLIENIICVGLIKNLLFFTITFKRRGTERLSRYSDSLRDRRSGDRITAGDEILCTRPDRL
jgi:hypothetical protein